LGWLTITIIKGGWGRGKCMEKEVVMEGGSQEEGTDASEALSLHIT
jgi:hypothetical protein